MQYLYVCVCTPYVREKRMVVIYVPRVTRGIVADDLVEVRSNIRLVLVGTSWNILGEVLFTLHEPTDLISVHLVKLIYLRIPTVLAHFSDTPLSNQTGCVAVVFL